MLFDEKELFIEANNEDGAFILSILFRIRVEIYHIFRLEVDLLLGSWAAKHVMSLNDDDLKQYEDILNEETVHIFHFLTAKGEIPKVYANEKSFNY